MEISVTVVRADTGAAFDCELPDDVQMEPLLTELVASMGLPRLGPDGDVIAYELSNKRTGDGLASGTLAAKGVKPGDVLLLTSTFVAGGEVAESVGLFAVGFGIVSFLLGSVFLFIVATIVVDAFILSKFWAWFLVPTFGWRSITLGIAVSLSCLKSWAHPIRPRDKSKPKDEKEAKEAVGQLAITVADMLLLRPACLLGMGWLVKEVML